MRITGQITQNNLTSILQKQKMDMEKIEKDVASGTVIHLPSDDPIAMSSRMLLTSRMSELGQYNRNIKESYDRMQLMDNQLGRVTDIMQRIRYLTIQAANGTNSSFELKEAIAREVDEHLKALIDLGNVKDATGRNLFAGSVLKQDPFRVVYNNLTAKGSGIDDMIMGVEYQGDIFQLRREIERREEMTVSLPGNHVFWGTNTQIDTNKDSSNYIASGNQKFKIDGTVFNVAAQDTLDDIIGKINAANINVTALQGTQNNMILVSKTPHQIWLEDIQGGTVLQDIGLIDNFNDQSSPNNYHPSANVTGLSLFDVIITLRDDLIKNDQHSVGGRDLEAIDMALENVLRHRSEIGAKTNRLEQHEKRIAWDTNYTQELLAHNESTDMIESIMQLKWLETVHNYALKVGSKLIQPTLMDFLN